MGALSEVEDWILQFARERHGATRWKPNVVLTVLLTMNASLSSITLNLRAAICVTQ